MKNVAYIQVDAERCFYPIEEGERLGDLPGFGELGVPDGDKINDNLNRLAQAAVDGNKEIATTFDKHLRGTAHISENPNYVDTWPEHGIDGTPGAEPHPDLLTAQMPTIATEFIKGNVIARTPEEDDSYTATLAHIRETGEMLPDFLKRKNVGRVVVAGLAIGDGNEHPLCVDSTAMRFQQLGFEVAVVVDATEAVLPENRELCFKNLGKLGIRLLTTAEAVAELEAA